MKIFYLNGVFRYPIYHIPMGRTIKDLSTCFLTYHTLSSSFQGILSIFVPIHFDLRSSLFIFFVCVCVCLRVGELQGFFGCVGTDMDLEADVEGADMKRKEGEGISLPPFGLATYKMQGNVWVSGNYGRDQEKLVSLLSVADSWLKQLKVQHHDFNYFTGIRRG